MSKTNPESKAQVWGERMSEPPHGVTVAYCAGRDVMARPMADAVLIPYDVWQNRAHVTMLARQGIMSATAARDVLAALEKIENLHHEGKFALDPAKEDVHINIEHFVAETVGQEAAGAMHTARSRNDQTATVVRMYVRDELLHLGLGLCELVASLVRVAKRTRDIPVAGLTHYQPASVTTLGHWLASYAQALVRDLDRLLATYDRINISPLGAAASFGTSWPIDREFTARCLGFERVQENSLDCITNRWEMEADAATCVSFALTHLSIVAQDLVLLSHPHFGILRLADRHTTGSSIMPQKRNPDFAEVTRAKAVVVQQLTSALFGIARGLVSGYNRDTQWTKYLIMDIFAEANAAPEVFRSVFDNIEVCRERAQETASSHFVDAVDVADNLARAAQIPFRQAYKLVSRAVRECDAQGSLSEEVVSRLARDEDIKLKENVTARDPLDLVQRKRHLGAPSAESVLANLHNLECHLRACEKELSARRRKIEGAKKYLATAIERLVVSNEKQKSLARAKRK